MIEKKLILENCEKKQCDQIEARGKQICFSPATWTDHQ
jgi:hypothetical protein